MPRPWKTPDIPPGPLLRLNRELHALHKRAGYPSARALQEAAGGGDVVSHTRIHHALTKPVLPGWGVVEMMVEELAKRARPRVDQEAEVDRFKVLWDAAGDDAGTPVEMVNPSSTGTGVQALGRDEALRNLGRSLGRMPAALGGDEEARDQEQGSSQGPGSANQALVAELQRIKDENALSFDAMARRSKISRSTWSRVLSRQVMPPRAAIVSLCAALRLDDTELLRLYDAAVAEHEAAVAEEPRRNSQLSW
ncbi:helix-turn-helix domain-containing protein [Streptomyces sp. NPDC058664]|uniref:helix-turn-helix domain-containing protein n=1 Tax=unclassified Streptomyces TaxID=2593676 RepID=UPI00364867B3